MADFKGRILRKSTARTSLGGYNTGGPTTVEGVMLLVEISEGQQRVVKALAYHQPVFALAVVFDWVAWTENEQGEVVTSSFTTMPK